MPVQSLSAVTLIVIDMATTVAFYDALGLDMRHGGPDERFTSYAVGTGYLNLQAGEPGDVTRWGRVILYVDDVDAVWQQALAAGATRVGEPADASWGERYVHVRDPDGHELSFARPLDDRPVLQVGVRAADVAALHAMNEAEVPAVGSLDAAAFADLLDLADRTVIVRTAGRIAAFMVVFEEGSAYASPNYRWFSDRLPAFAYVDRIVVAPDALRRGLGGLLYAHAVGFADHRPLTAEVNTRPPNDISLAFHATQGFVEMGRLASADGTKEVVMLRRSAPTAGPEGSSPP